MCRRHPAEPSKEELLCPEKEGGVALSWDWRHVTQHMGLEQGKFSAKFLVTGKLLFQNLQVILDLLSLSFPRSFCFINNQVLKILPSKYFSKWPLLSTWLHWTSAVASFFNLLPSALQLLHMHHKVLYNLSLTWPSGHIFHSAICTFSPAHVLALGLGCSLQTRVSPLRKYNDITSTYGD